MSEENGNAEYEWIVVYTNSSSDVTLWGPNYSTYNWKWLLWFYAPGATITTTNGFNGIISLREVTCEKIIGYANALSFGLIGQTQRVDVKTH